MEGFQRFEGQGERMTWSNSSLRETVLEEWMGWCGGRLWKAEMRDKMAEKWQCGETVLSGRLRGPASVVWVKSQTWKMGRRNSPQLGSVWLAFHWRKWCWRQERCGVWEQDEREDCRDTKNEYCSGGAEFEALIGHQDTGIANYCEECWKNSFGALQRWARHSRVFTVDKNPLPMQGICIVDKNPLANAGGREFDPWTSKIPHATEQLNLCITPTEALMP